MATASTTFIARRYDPSHSYDPSRTRIVHFVRHAQGQHNKAVAETGTEAEYCNWAWFDSRLTELGKEQATSLRPKLERPEHAVEGDRAPPFEALDLLRERIGTHPCDKRRPRAEIREDFPSVALHDLTHEEDEKWSEAREPMDDLIRRADDLLPLLRARPEHRIGIVSHNDYLTALFFDCSLRFEDDAMRVKFGNADHHALVIEWEDAKTPDA